MPDDLGTNDIQPALNLPNTSGKLNNNKFQYEIKWNIAVDAWSWKCGSRCEL